MAIISNVVAAAVILATFYAMQNVRVGTMIARQQVMSATDSEVFLAAFKDTMMERMANYWINNRASACGVATATFDQYWTSNLVDTDTGGVGNVIGNMKFSILPGAGNTGLPATADTRCQAATRQSVAGGRGIYFCLKIDKTARTTATDELSNFLNNNYVYAEVFHGLYDQSTRSTISCSGANAALGLGEAGETPIFGRAIYTLYWQNKNDARLKSSFVGTAEAPLRPSITKLILAELNRYQNITADPSSSPAPGLDPHELTHWRRSFRSSDSPQFLALRLQQMDTTLLDAIITKGFSDVFGTGTTPTGPELATWRTNLKPKEQGGNGFEYEQLMINLAVSNTFAGCTAFDSNLKPVSFPSLVDNYVPSPVWSPVPAAYTSELYGSPDTRDMCLWGWIDKLFQRFENVGAGTTSDNVINWYYNKMYNGYWTPQTVAAAFVRGNTYTLDWVRWIYQRVLGRAPTTGPGSEEALLTARLSLDCQKHTTFGVTTTCGNSAADVSYIAPTGDKGGLTLRAAIMEIFPNRINSPTSDDRKTY